MGVYFLFCQPVITGKKVEEKQELGVRERYMFVFVVAVFDSSWSIPCVKCLSV